MIERVGVEPSRGEAVKDPVERSVQEEPTVGRFHEREVTPLVE